MAKGDKRGIDFRNDEQKANNTTNQTVNPPNLLRQGGTADISHLILVLLGLNQFNHENLLTKKMRTHCKQTPEKV